MGQGLAIEPRPDEKGGSWKNLICNPIVIMVQPLGGSLFALEAKEQSMWGVGLDAVLGGRYEIHCEFWSPSKVGGDKPQVPHGQ